MSDGVKRVRRRSWRITMSGCRQRRAPVSAPCDRPKGAGCHGSLPVGSSSGLLPVLRARLLWRAVPACYGPPKPRSTRASRTGAQAGVVARLCEALAGERCAPSAGTPPGGLPARTGGLSCRIGRPRGGLPAKRPAMQYRSTKSARGPSVHTRRPKSAINTKCGTHGPDTGKGTEGGGLGAEMS